MKYTGDIKLTDQEFYHIDHELHLRMSANRTEVHQSKD